MNKVITKLYEIEETAGDILKNAQQYKEQLQRKMEQAQQDYACEQEEELKQRLEFQKLEFDQYAQQEIRQLVRKYQQRIQSLEDAYDGHLKELAEEIFDRITEV